MSSRHSRLFLFIFLILFPVSAISQESVSSEDITYAANFYADYVDLFGEPPNVLIINENRINLAQAAYLFAKAVSAKTDEVKLIDIKGYDNFTTNTESEITKKDVIAVSRLYARYLERFHEFPYLIKLNRVFASNADFIYILADMLRQKYKSNSFPEKIKNKKLYFEDIINWNSDLAESKERYAIFTVDYESDRPVFSEEFNRFNLKKQVDSETDKGVNPRFIENICYGQFCILPDDYDAKGYASEEISWFTSILNSSNEEIYPSCYPFCGTLEGTNILINEFITKYNFPMVWFMSGRSIIAIAAHSEENIDKMKNLNKNGLLGLGLHTMYHTNMNVVSQEFMERTLKENTEVFTHVFNITPIEFRTPYLALAKDNEHLGILKSINVPADNEDMLIDSYCWVNRSRCNYEFNLSSVHICKIDWLYNENDPLINMFLIHPWGLLFREKGSPTHLEFSETAKIDVFKNWMRLTGKYGLIPTLPKKVYNENK